LSLDTTALLLPLETTSAAEAGIVERERSSSSQRRSLGGIALGESNADASGTSDVRGLLCHSRHVSKIGSMARNSTAQC